MINSQTDAFSREKAVMASHLEMKNRSSHSPPVQTSSKQTVASVGSAVTGHGQYGSGTLWSGRFCPQPLWSGKFLPILDLNFHIVTSEDLQGTSEPSTSLQSLGYLISSTAPGPTQVHRIQRDRRRLDGRTLLPPVTKTVTALYLYTDTLAQALCVVVL